MIKQTESRSENTVKNEKPLKWRGSCDRERIRTSDRLETFVQFLSNKSPTWLQRLIALRINQAGMLALFLYGGQYEKGFLKIHQINVIFLKVHHQKKKDFLTFFGAFRRNFRYFQSLYRAFPSQVLNMIY